MNLTNELAKARIDYEVAISSTNSLVAYWRIDTGYNHEIPISNTVVTITFGQKWFVHGFFRIYCNEYSYTDYGSDVMVDYYLRQTLLGTEKKFNRIDEVIQKARSKSGWGLEYQLAYLRGEWHPTNELFLVTQPIRKKGEP